MRINLFNRIFRKNKKNGVEDNRIPVNSELNYDSIDNKKPGDVVLSNSSSDNKETINSALSYNSINIDTGENLIKIEINEDCDFKLYCNERDRKLQEDISKMDNNMIDMVKNIPMRMLILKGIKKIYQQTIYLISTDEFEYIISKNADNIHISESRVVNNEIEESTIEICYSNREYEISKYIHDLNRSTKSVKNYIPGRKIGIESFDMDREEAISTANTLMQHLEKIELIRNTLDLQYISSFLSFAESTNMNTINNTKKTDKEITEN